MWHHRYLRLSGCRVFPVMNPDGERRECIGIEKYQLNVAGDTKLKELDSVQTLFFLQFYCRILQFVFSKILQLNCRKCYNFEIFYSSIKKLSKTQWNCRSYLYLLLKIIMRVFTIHKNDHPPLNVILSRGELDKVTKIICYFATLSKNSTVWIENCRKCYTESHLKL